jgi:hypothetical protein
VAIVRRKPEVKIGSELNMNRRKLCIVAALVAVLAVSFIPFRFSVADIGVTYGFEDGTTDAFDGVGGTPVVGSTEVYSGAYSCYFDAWNDALNDTLASPVNTVYPDIKIYFDSLPAADTNYFTFIEVYSTTTEGLAQLVNDGGTVKWQLQARESDYVMRTYTNDTAGVSAGSWYSVTMNRTASGTCQLYVNDVLILESAETLGQQTAQIFIGSRSGQAVDYYIDNYRPWASYPTRFDYTVEAVSGMYYGKENVESYRSTNSSSAETCIESVHGWFSAGSTCEFIGDFTIDDTVDISTNCSLDFTQATVTGDVSDGYVFSITASLWINGGNFTGNYYNSGFRWIGGVGNNTVSNVEFVNFKLILTQYCGDQFVLRDSYLHDATDLSYYGAINNDGNNTFQNVTVYNTANNIGGFYVAEWCENNMFRNCTFDDMGYHSIYLSSYNTEGASLGGHEVVDCTFKNFKNNNMAGIHLKCNATNIHNCLFTNFTDSWNNPAISIYADFDYSNCDDNRIHNCTFQDMWEPIRIGSSLANVPMHNNKFYNCTFRDIGADVGVFTFGYGSVPEATQNITDTWIYLCNFINCANTFDSYSYDRGIVQDTVIACNNFSTAISQTEIDLLTNWTNTMIYNNTGLDDYNVPEVLPVNCSGESPEPTPTPPPTPTPTPTPTGGGGGGGGGGVNPWATPTPESEESDQGFELELSFPVILLVVGLIGGILLYAGSKSTKTGRS